MLGAPRRCVFGSLHAIAIIHLGLQTICTWCGLAPAGSPAAPCCCAWPLPASWGPSPTSSPMGAQAWAGMATPPSSRWMASAQVCVAQSLHACCVHGVHGLAHGGFATNLLRTAHPTLPTCTQTTASASMATGPRWVQALSRTLLPALSSTWCSTESNFPGPLHCMALAICSSLEASVKASVHQRLK